MVGCTSSEKMPKFTGFWVEVVHGCEADGKTGSFPPFLFFLSFSSFPDWLLPFSSNWIGPLNPLTDWFSFPSSGSLLNL